MVKRKLSQIRSELLKYIRELKKQGITPSRVILYGSYSNGTATKESDVDIVIISSDLAKLPPLKRLEVLSIATAHINAPFDVIGYTPAEIKKHCGDSIFWDEIIRTGKDIYKKAA